MIPIVSYHVSEAQALELKTNLRSRRNTSDAKLTRHVVLMCKEQGANIF